MAGIPHHQKDVVVSIVHISWTLKHAMLFARSKYLHCHHRVVCLRRIAGCLLPRDNNRRHRFVSVLRRGALNGETASWRTSCLSSQHHNAARVTQDTGTTAAHVARRLRAAPLLTPTPSGLTVLSGLPIVLLRDRPIAYPGSCRHRQQGYC